MVIDPAFCWLIPSKTRYLALGQRRLYARNIRSILFIVPSDLPAVQVESMTFAPKLQLRLTTSRTHLTSQPQSDRINMGTQDPMKENL